MNNFDTNDPACISVVNGYKIYFCLTERVWEVFSPSFNVAVGYKTSQKAAEDFAASLKPEGKS